MLPSSLVDLLRERLSQHGNVLLNIQARGHIRRVQQLAVRPAGPVGHGSQPQKIPRRPIERVTRDRYSLRVQQAEKQVQAVSELEERVAALNETVGNQSDQAKNTPYFREAELQNIYKDLLSFPESGSSTAEHVNLVEETKLDVIQVLEGRLPRFEEALRAQKREIGLSKRLDARRTIASPSMHHDGSWENPQTDILPWATRSPPRVLIARLRVVLDTLQSNLLRTDDNTSSSGAPSVPFGLLSNTEWEALVQACLDADDAPASEMVLDLMKRSGLAPSDQQYDSILNWFATRGLVQNADSYMSRLAVDAPRERQRDLLVKARIKAGRLRDACALIHSFETRNLPAPMQSYTRVIQALLSQRSPGSEQQKAQAWDMFSHMRYVAHATADRFLYNVMIRACAESADPEPERALDLFTEMTVDKNIPPTTHTYNAVILTCARSKKFALDAFRLAREMLNSHRDAYGAIPAHLQPDNNTFYALLEAAKRMRDLPRARWILAQVTHNARDADKGGRAVHVDQKVMTHVFHAYASYRPPFQREAVALVPEGEAESSLPPEGQVGEDSQTREVKTSDYRRPRGAPQSRQEVLKEAVVLWNRILGDRQAAGQTSHDPSRSPPIFGRVSLTTSLLNAYMAVHYAHSPPSTSYKVYGSLFDSLGVQRDAFTYVLALEAYASGKRVPDTELPTVLSYARDVWKRWRELENGGVIQMSDPKNRPGVDARLVERAWTAMMRILTLSGNLSEAVDLLHQFADHYPPSLVRKPSPSDPSRSTRTSLYAERPIVRLTERSAVPEDRITPFLTFNDLGLLHHRAILEKRTDVINYIKWVAKAYEGSLRRRRVESAR